MKEGEFDQDPTGIPHVCEQMRYYHKERCNSMLYEATHELRTAEHPKMPSVAFTGLFGKIAAHPEYCKIHLFFLSIINQF